MSQSLRDQKEHAAMKKLQRVLYGQIMGYKHQVREKYIKRTDKKQRNGAQGKDSCFRKVLPTQISMTNQKRNIRSQEAGKLGGY